jgi:integrase
MFEDLDKPEDLVAYRAKRKTLSNHLKAIQALFNFAAKGGLLSADGQPSVNPIAGVDFNPGEGNQRDDFTPEDRRVILILARHAEPHIYWLNWLGSYTGARLSELADAHTRDVVQVEGVWVIKIHTKNRSRDQRLKTIVSIRDVPLHSALLDESILEYVASVGDGPLFPQLRLDGYGRRSGQASTEISDWLRKAVKITEPDKSWYSQRHTATSYLRNTMGPDGTPKVKEDIEHYLLGHGRKGRKGAHGGYGKRWVEALWAAIEVIPNPL